jgi:hypothetical protein
MQLRVCGLVFAGVFWGFCCSWVFAGVFSCFSLFFLFLYTSCMLKGALVFYKISLITYQKKFTAKEHGPKPSM